MARRNGGFIGTDGLDAPDPPTGVTVSGGVDGVASISFTAPTDAGTSAITGFVATASTGVGATGTSSPISVSGLAIGTAATFRAYAINAYGTSAASDASSSITPAASRGLIYHGQASSGSTSSKSNADTIEYITISSTGNATDFGNLSASTHGQSALASSTRAVSVGGDGSLGTSMEYVTIASTGNTTDFGDTGGVVYGGAFASSTRGVFNAAYRSGVSNVIEYITTASPSNSTDFGDLSVSRAYNGGLSSPTRGIFIGGATDAGNSSLSNVLDYVTIASAGNATDFGNLLSATTNLTGCGSSTRGITGGGQTGGSGTEIDVMQYVTIASTGNATDFGNLTQARSQKVACVSSLTRATFNGGSNAAGDTRYNIIDYVTIASTGNASDFGDLGAYTANSAGTSNAHGGL